MKKKLLLILFVTAFHQVNAQSKKIDDYSTLEGLYSAEVENIIGKPDVVKEDGEVKVYFYKQVLETNFGKKCDLFLYFDGENSGRFTNDIVGTIDIYSCKIE